MILRIHYILILFTALLSTSVQAQLPQLPDMIAATDKGVVILNWDNQYKGLKSIAVQRSSDSVFNYVTVGYVANLKEGPQAFIDGHPNPGENWYRLNIGFSSDLTWFSNRVKINIDSADILNKGVVPPNDSLQKYASTVKIDMDEIVASSKDKDGKVSANKGNVSINLPTDPNANQFSYIKSQYVFTNPFTGHVTVQLPGDGRSIYAIEFYTMNENTKPMLEIPRIRHKEVIIDKRNFGKKGIYKFMLYEGDKKMEEGYVTIY